MPGSRDCSGQVTARGTRIGLSGAREAECVVIWFPLSGVQAPWLFLLFLLRVDVLTGFDAVLRKGESVTTWSEPSPGSEDTAEPLTLKDWPAVFPRTQLVL